jgi:uncharacterized protein YfaS (alpha-2-macroglobulin family)
VTEVHQAGETLRVTATITDAAGDPADPTTTVISVAKPDGTLDIDGAAMTQSVSGTYYYDYAIPSDTGVYRAEVKATGSTGRITLKPDNFRVEAAI